MSIISPGDDIGTEGVQRPSYSMSGGVASCSERSRGMKRVWLNNERLGVGICGLWIVSFGLARCGMGSSWCMHTSDQCGSWTTGRLRDSL
jgi:hypothetical protein